MYQNLGLRVIFRGDRWEKCEVIGSPTNLQGWWCVGLGGERVKFGKECFGYKENVGMQERKKWSVDVL